MPKNPSDAPVAKSKPKPVAKFEMVPRSTLTRFTRDGLIDDVEIPESLKGSARTRYLAELYGYAGKVACTKGIAWLTKKPGVLRQWWQVHQVDPAAAWQIWLEMHPDEKGVFEANWVDAHEAVDKPGKALSLAMETLSANESLSKSSVA